MRGSLHRELLEKLGAEVMAGAAVLLRKVVSLTDRAQYVNIPVITWSLSTGTRVRRGW